MEAELREALEAAQSSHLKTQEAYEASKKEVARIGRVSAEQQVIIERIEAATDEKLAAAQAKFDEMEKTFARDRAIGGNSKADELTVELASFNMQLLSQMNFRKNGSSFVALEADHYATYKKGLNAYLRGGPQALDQNPDFRSAMSIGSDPDGGYLVPADMTGRTVEFVFETSPLRQFANVTSTERDAKTGRYDLDEAGAEWVGEKSTRSRTSTPKRGKYTIPIHEQHANLPVTQNELDDAGENVEAYLARKAGNKFGRAENTAFVSGDGVSRPRGFDTYPAGNPTATAFEKITQVNTGAAGAFKANPKGPDIFKDLAGNLKSPYLPSAAWAMKRATLQAARKLQDSEGVYQILMDRDPRGRAAFSIEGLPVAMFDDMATIAANSLSIALANWNEAYEIVDRGGIRVLRDPYTAKTSGEVELDFYKRVGGAVVNFDAIKLAKFAA